jgi:hypothetical protein
MKQPQVLPIGSNLQDLTQKELQLGRFPLLYRIMTVFLHPRG